jgi:hypothetical protein
VITGSGGRHIYFLTDAPIRNEASGKLGQGIDVRGIGGQVLAPPTVHPNGKTYEWVEGKSIAEHTTSRHAVVDGADTHRETYR